jgi:F0F1-type ATP synthase gamma subunit
MLLKQFDLEYNDYRNEVDVYVIGKKAREYCTRRGYTIVGSLSLQDTFVSDDLKELYKILHQAQSDGNYKEISVRYNFFKNTMKQIPV